VHPGLKNKTFEQSILDVAKLNQKFPFENGKTYR